jgi:hypothetical protein
LVCLSIHLSVCLFACLSVHLSVCLCLCMYIYLCLCVHVCLSACLLVLLLVCLHDCESVGPILIKYCGTSANTTLKLDVCGRGTNKQDCFTYYFNVPGAKENKTWQKQSQLMLHHRLSYFHFFHFFIFFSYFIFWLCLFRQDAWCRLRLHFCQNNTFCQSITWAKVNFFGTSYYFYFDWIEGLKRDSRF